MRLEIRECDAYMLVLEDMVTLYRHSASGQTNCRCEVCWYLREKYDHWVNQFSFKEGGYPHGTPKS